MVLKVTYFNSVNGKFFPDIFIYFSETYLWPLKNWNWKLLGKTTPIAITQIETFFFSLS